MGMERVLSIQSHVVHGSVGNKSVVLPLQLLGFEVDAVNTVQLSNHTSYPAWRGAALDAAALGELVDGLRANGLLGGYSHLLTGYARSAALVRGMADVARELKAGNADVVFGAYPAH